MSATFGCAYWGRDAVVADRDFASLAATGFSWVVIPVSTERMQYDRAGAAAVVAAAKRSGLETRLAPWGVGGLFGGEGIAAAQYTPWEAIARWLEHAHHLHADAVLWDEPHGLEGVQAIERMRQTCRVPGAEYLYINPGRSEWPAARAVTGMAGIGVDAYTGPIDGLKRRRVAKDLYGLPVHVWVRNFGLSAAQTLHPADDIAGMLCAGMTDIGIWGYPASGCSCLDNAEPQRAWDAIAEVIRNQRTR